MRSLLPIALVVTMIGAGCGDGDGGLVADDAPTSTAAVESTTAASAPTSTLPTSVTVLPGDGNPHDAALEVMGMGWSTIETWADGWVEIATTVTGPPTLERDSEIGRLFSDEVHDAIEAAGATDMVTAISAVMQAGLVGEVLAVLDTHPEASVAISGPVTLAMTAATTVDGATWERRDIPFLAPGRLLASASDGARLALVFGERDGREVRLATTADLDRWSVATIATPFETADASVDVVVVPGGGRLLTARDSEADDSGSAWVVSDDGEAAETVLPGDESCCLLEATSAGVFAYAGDIGGSSSAWFSSDGIAWERRSVPDGMRITGAASVVGGLVLSMRDDATATTTQWRGNPGGEGWVSTDLPEEIGGEVSVFGNNHEGVAQHVPVVGWGRRGYQPAIPDVSFTVDHDGVRFAATIGQSSEQALAVTVTDLATGEVVFDRFGPVSGDLPVWARTTATDLELSDADGVVVAAVPLRLFEEAYAVALADAEVAATAADGPVTQAVSDAPYLLHSLDGITWSAMIVEPAGDSSSWTLAASTNGTRALIDDGDGGYRVVALVVE